LIAFAAILPDHLHCLVPGDGLHLIVAAPCIGYLNAFYQCIKQRRGAGKAIIATARKLLAIIYDTLRNGWVFEDFTEFKIKEKQSPAGQPSQKIPMAARPVRHGSRLHPVKLAATIVEKKTRIIITLPTSCPRQGLLHLLFHALAPPKAA
jgi:hypothetical protein